MNTNGRATGESPNVATSFAELSHDVIELAELQAKLLAYDVQKTSQNAKIAIALCLIGVCVLLGCIPVVLITIAEVLIATTDLSAAPSYAIATLIGLAVAGGTLAYGLIRFKKGVVALDRSREELHRNIGWLKSTLRNRGQSHPNPYPAG